MIRRKRSFLLLGLSFFILSRLSADIFNWQKKEYPHSVGIDIGDCRYKEGCYQGKADAYGPDLTVEIEIESGELIKIVIVEHNEVGKIFWQKPFRCIPDEIIKRQSTKVDTVAGATASSLGVIAAVENALSHAR